MGCSKSDSHLNENVCSACFLSFFSIVCFLGFGFGVAHILCNMLTVAGKWNQVELFTSIKMYFIAVFLIKSHNILSLPRFSVTKNGWEMRFDPYSLILTRACRKPFITFPWARPCSYVQLLSTHRVYRGRNNPLQKIRVVFTEEGVTVGTDLDPGNER